MPKYRKTHNHAFRDRKARLGYTFIEIAERAGVSRETAINASKGLSVRPETAWKLARAMNCEPTDIGLIA